MGVYVYMGSLSCYFLCKKGYGYVIDFAQYVPNPIFAKTT